MSLYATILSMFLKLFLMFCFSSVFIAIGMGFWKSANQSKIPYNFWDDLKHVFKPRWSYVASDPEDVPGSYIYALLFILGGIMIFALSVARIVFEIDLKNLMF